MGKTSAAVKNKWIKENCKQIKVCVPPETAEAFKAACESDKVSMSGEIAGFMKGRIGSAAVPPLKKDPLATRAGRRKSLSSIINQLEQVKGAEESYLSNIPENLQNSIRYEAAEECVGVLEGAIDLLREAF